MRVFEDIKNIKDNDPSIRSYLEVVLATPGLHAIWFHRLSHLLYKIRLFTLARIVMNISKFITGIEIHPGARIGRRVFIDHGVGVVIGETAVVCDDVTIFHQVTLGGRGNETEHDRHPKIMKGSMIAAGAKILGNIEIGPYAKVGANSVVLKPVPPFATAVGAPARIIPKEEHPTSDICSLINDQEKEIDDSKCSLLNKINKD
jgi:serine O-acetyltransferase